MYFNFFLQNEDGSTYMNEPWTMVLGLTGGVGAGWVQRGKGGQLGQR